VLPSPLGAVSLPLHTFGKAAVYFCSDQGVRKEHSRSYATEEQRRAEQKDQGLVYTGCRGNDTQGAGGAIAISSKHGFQCFF